MLKSSASRRLAFDYATEHGYDVLVTIDCDGQHEPRLIPELASRVFPEQGEPVDIVVLRDGELIAMDAVKPIKKKLGELAGKTLKNPDVEVANAIEAHIRSSNGDIAKAADKALYQVKHQGRNNYKVFEGVPGDVMSQTSHLMK